MAAQFWNYHVSIKFCNIIAYLLELYIGGQYTDAS